MTYIEYCDKCGKQIVGWDNEYGQVMSIRLEIESDSNGGNGIITGKQNFCSAACASEYLQGYIKKEREWLDVWKRGNILGIAPVRPKKKTRSGE